jgi:predicted dehydrogenase
MTGPAHDVLIVGLGAISRTHIRVLEQIPAASVVAGVDTAVSALQFRGRPVPVYPEPAQAARHHHPDVVVIATPTPTHAAVCDQAAAAFPAARILVEKPAAGTIAGARHILADIGARQRVDIAYHMSYSPEVGWGLNTATARAGELGRPIAIRASFTDPYSGEADSAAARYGSSWIDSGINALSIVNRFTQLRDRVSLRARGPQAWSAFEARINCGADAEVFEALILTSWHVTDPAKATTISYSSGAELVMDHTAVAGYLIQDNQVTEFFGSDRSVSRQERHYRALYQSWLVSGQPIAPAQIHLHLHDLLLRPAG